MGHTMANTEPMSMKDSIHSNSKVTRGQNKMWSLVVYNVCSLRLSKTEKVAVRADLPSSSPSSYFSSCYLTRKWPICVEYRNQDFWLCCHNSLKLMKIKAVLVVLVAAMFLG